MIYTDLVNKLPTFGATAQTAKIQNERLHFEKNSIDGNYIHPDEMNREFLSKTRQLGRFQAGTLCSYCLDE